MLSAFQTFIANPETIARMSALSSIEDALQSDIIKAREFHDGIQFVKLTDRLREFMGGDTSSTETDYERLRLNIARIVVTAVIERLLVSGFDTNEMGIATPVTDAAGLIKTDANGADLMQTVKPLASWAWEVWQVNRMDAKQKRVHEACVRDGEAFVIVDWLNNEGVPRFTPHVRYVDQSVGTGASANVGEGCQAYYRNDDADQDLLYVTKRWVEVWFDEAGRRNERQRLTVYLPDKIAKYAGFPGAWNAVKDDPAEPWPIPWVDASGQPLGIPVAHFRSTTGQEAREAWPAQNAINFLAVLELAAADMTAFRILIALGWSPVDANGVPLEIAPGRWLGTTNANGRVEVIDPADIGPISNLIESWTFRAAMVTDTPVTRFITTKQVASEGTQKQQEGSLINKVRNRQGEIGNAWEDCMSIARRLANTFGRGGLDEQALIYTKWEPAEARDETAELAQATQKMQLQVPVEQIWTELGYSQEKIASWKADADARRQEMLALQQQALSKQPSNNGNGSGRPF